MAKIIIADDEDNLRMLIKDFLAKKGHTVLEADDGDVALKLFEEHNDVELLILDVMMPELDGWATCKKIRETSNVPVIMLTARSEEFDQLMGFECGADDYVTKPFSLQVLVKRVEVLLKRSDSSFNAHKQQFDKGLHIEHESYTAYLDGNNLEFTLKEYEVLDMLLQTPNRVYTRDQMLNNIWGYDYEGDPRTVDSHIARIRTKLGDWGIKHLKTVYGVGYKIELID